MSTVAELTAKEIASYIESAKPGNTKFNDLQKSIDDINAKIGDMSVLETIDHTTLVKAINEAFTTIKSIEARTSDPTTDLYNGRIWLRTDL